MKNLITKLKNSPQGIYEQANETISEPEDWAFEIKSKEQKEKRMKKRELSPRDILSNRPTYTLRESQK